ncbi:tail fiber protein [Bacteroides phage BF695P2]|nr:tail fiber protein [Bacteroides phage BF695P2]
MNVFELLIQKIRSVNGAIVVSQSNGKVTSVEDTGTQYKITFGEEFPTFQEGDLIRCQSWSKNNLKFYWVEVKTAADGYVLCDKSEFNNVVPAVGDEVVQMGNTKNVERQALIYITAQERGKPYIEILNGVKTKSLTGTDRTRLGDLSNIVDPDFTGEAAVKGTGFYSTNAFLKGIFVLRNGKRVEDEIKIAKDAADKAAQDAANAAQSAQEAKDRLNKWADDGFISPTEKPALIDEGKRIQAEYLQIKANADKYGVLVTEYTEAYNNYLNELRYHSAETPEDIAVRPELAQSQTAYYDKRNGALNAIATASKDYVDNADKQLKEYLDTEITAIPGKIELAVRSLKVADVNLLKGGYKELRNESYAIGYYPYDVPVINGKEYTLTVCYTLPANNAHIGAYANEGSDFLANFVTKGDKVIESKKVTMAGYKPAEGLYFYQFPSGTYGSKVHWAVLTDGNLGVASWIPSASERRVGIRNLFPVSRMKTVTNQQLNYFDISGWATTIYDESEFKSRFKPSTTYTITGKYTILDKPADGGGYKDSLIAFCMYDNTTVIDLWRKYVGDETVGTTGGISNTFTTPSNLDGYRITVYTMYNSGNLGEIRFTDLMVSEGINEVGWSQAPEDALAESIKYTDTQILAVDGKIELSVTTKVNQIGVGGDNLVRYYSDEFDSYPPYNSNPIVKDSYAIETTWNGSNTACFLTVKNKRIKNGQIPDFCYRFRMLINGVPATEDRIVGKKLTTYAVSGEMYYGGDGNFYGFVKGNTNHWFINVPTTGINSGDVIRIENFIASNGTVCPGFSPASADISFLNERFTQSKIDIVEGKITSTVKQINSVDGKVTGLASRVTQTESSINSVVGDINTLNNTTDRHITKQVDLTGWDNNKFFPLVIQIPTYYKAKVVINRPLNAKYGKPSYATHGDGFSMNLSFEMSGSGWGSLPAVTNIFDYTRAWNTGKIVVDLGQITQSSTCVMGLRGGSKYDVTLHEDTNPAAINVYQTDYVGPFGQVFPVRTDGAEPFRTYGYYSEIKQTQESLSATVAKVDDQGNRLSAAELTLSADHAKLGVVEGTANSANTAAGNAQNTANAASSTANYAKTTADATANGLTFTGIYIAQKKIILASNNVVFQNNAGQQTAALNANGRLTAKVIEAGEVVANGFAAQRITTGNLTVTDGAVIAGMTISGGVLTGKNINITDGARVGSFTISSGVFSAQEVPAGIQMTLAGNASTFDSSGVRVDNNSGGYALTTTGKGKIFLTGSDFWVQCKDVDFMGAQTWKAPGVFYACTILANGAIGKTWGNPDFHITRVIRNSAGRYTVYTTGSNGDYFVMITGYNVTSWLSTTVEPYSEGQFTYKVFDVNNGMTDSAVIIYFCGMVR